MKYVRQSIRQLHFLVGFFFFFLKSSSKGMFTDFRERGRVRERQGKRGGKGG